MNWVLIAICLFVAFIFSGIEAGILSMNRVRLRHQVKLRDRAALKLERLLAHPERLLVTVLVVTNLANIFAITLLAQEAVARWNHAGYLITLAISLPVYLLGTELLPKSLFRRFPYRALAFLAEPLRFADLLLAPLHFLGEKVARIFRRGPDEPKKIFVAREDFKYLTIETERAGSLSHVERKMIHGVVDFRSLTADQVMTPIDQIATIPAQTDVADLIRQARATGADRWPVEGPNRSLIGIVNMLDVALSGRRAGSVDNFQRRIVKLAPKEPAYTILHKLRAARSRMAAVIGPEGKPIGIVTWENVVMRLVKTAVS